MRPSRWLPILAMAACLVGTRAQATEITIAIEPGRPAKPAQVRGKQFLLDSRGLLVVVDYMQGFVLGRFVAPPGIDLTAGDPGGVSLELPESASPPPTTQPQTSLPAQIGFPFEAESPIVASPCPVDLDGNGRREIVLSTLAGLLYVISHEGRLLPAWPLSVDDEFFAPPAAGDLDGDGDLEIVIGGTSGWLYAFHHDAAPVSGWPIPPGLGQDRMERDARALGMSDAGPGIFGACALADINGDGRAEVCVASADGLVRVFAGNGELRDGWPKRLSAGAVPPNPAAMFASPAVGDIDGDGTAEIIVATNAYRVFAWRPSGELLSGWPVKVPHRARAGYGDIALGDVNGDRRLEVIVTSEHGFEGHATVSAIGADGGHLPGWPRPLRESANAGPALADLSGDGTDDVIVATIGGDAAVVVLSGPDSRPLDGWPVRLKSETVNAAPIVAELDGDGLPDVLVAALSTEVQSQTWLWALGGHGRELPGFPILLPNDEIVRAAPAVSDLDGDGDNELIVATELRNTLYVWDLQSHSSPRENPWPMLAGGPSRTGRVGGVDDAVAASAGLVSGDTPAGSARPDPVIPGTEIPAGASAQRQATIDFDLPHETDVRLAIFSIRGEPIRQIFDLCLPPGRYAIRWDGRDEAGTLQPSGIYFYELDLEGRATTKQLLLLQ